MIVPPTALPETADTLRRLLQASLDAWSSGGYKLVWLEIPLQNAYAVPVAAEAGFTFPNGAFTLPRQWGATENGLIFYFNSYEIAPYSEGPTEFALPWSALREIIKPEAGLVPAPKS